MHHNEGTDDLVKKRKELYENAARLAGSSVLNNHSKEYSSLLQKSEAILKDPTLSKPALSKEEMMEWQNLIFKIKALQNNSAVIKNVQLDQFPDPIEKPIPGSQITIGDLHGNAIVFLYYLIKQGILTLANGAADYKILFDLYGKSKVNGDFSKQDLEQFTSILQKSTIQNIVLIRLIGDELSDRGHNDLLTLLIMARLQQAKLPFEIIFSNHGLAFFEFISFKYQQAGTTLHPSYMSSIFGLMESLAKNVITKAELDELINTVYLPHVKLLSYSIDDLLTPQNITIYSHAPIGINTLKSLAKNFHISYDDSSVHPLANTIDQINEKFRELVLNMDILKVIALEWRTNHVQSLLAIEASMDAPILRTIWTRLELDKFNDSNYQDPDPRPQNNGDRYTMHWVHGHDGSGYVPKIYEEYIRNLDNQLGKLRLTYVQSERRGSLAALDEGDYAIHFTFEKSSV